MLNFRLRRRNFLLGFASPFLRPLSAQPAPPVNAGFHLHPHYRSPSPLDAMLQKTQAGYDEFITEKHQDRIAAILAEWSAGLLDSPRNLAAIEKCIVGDFSGSPLDSFESRVVRS